MKERHPENKKYLPEEVLNLTKYITRREGKREKVDFDGNLINMASDRYKCFDTHGVTCVACGVKGEYFALERDSIYPTYHFNLYGVVDGEEVLMTKDHIIAKSKGGPDHIDNFQTMCTKCNLEKGDS